MFLPYTYCASSTQHGNTWLILCNWCNEVSLLRHSVLNVPPVLSMLLCTSIKSTLTLVLLHQLAMMVLSYDLLVITGLRLKVIEMRKCSKGVPCWDCILSMFGCHRRCSGKSKTCECVYWCVWRVPVSLALWACSNTTCLHASCLCMPCSCGTWGSCLQFSLLPCHSVGYLSCASSKLRVRVCTLVSSVCMPRVNSGLLACLCIVPSQWHTCRLCLASNCVVHWCFAHVKNHWSSEVYLYMIWSDYIMNVLNDWSELCRF